MTDTIDPSRIPTSTVFRFAAPALLGLLARGLGLPEGCRVLGVSPPQEGGHLLFLEDVPPGSAFRLDDHGIPTYHPPEASSCAPSPPA